MRVGTNPLRNIKAPHSLTGEVMTFVTHLPNVDGYHKHRMDVIKACLSSAVKNSPNRSVIIWDNGSMKPLKEWIKVFIKPDIFVESVNIGKSQARKMLFSMLPPATIASYSDDDILHYPGWYDEQLDLLRNFHNAAAVTGYVVRTAFRWGVENTKKWAEQNGKLTGGRFIPEEHERDFCISIGRDWNVHKQGTLNDLDWIVEYNGMKAYTTAHHCQFMARAGLAAEAMVWDGNAMGDEKIFDVRLDQLGLRLGTIRRVTRHIGNVIDKEIAEDVKKYG